MELIINNKNLNIKKENKNIKFNYNCDCDKLVKTVSDMKKLDLSEGTTVQTLGYYRPGDSGAAKYIIKTYDYYLNTWLPIDCRKVGTVFNRLGTEFLLIDTPVDEYGNHTLDNGLVACLLDKSDIKAEQYGCKGDGIFDNSESFIHLFAHAKNGKITFKKDAVYNYPERNFDNYNHDVFKTYTNPYNAYMCGRSSSNQRITMANVDGLEIDGNGATIKLPDNQWNKNKMADLAIINLYRVIRNLKIHDLIIDGNGLTMDADNGVENHGIAWKTGNTNSSYATLPTVSDGTVHEISNLEIYNCTFKNLGTAKSINDCGGDGILLINPLGNSHDINIHHNKFYNWGRWVFAIDLGGDGECIENVKFNDNECIQFEDNINLGGNFRGLGWIDFEARKCFKNLEVCRNYVKGCNGWAFNGNNKVSENVTINDNTVIRTVYGFKPAGIYPYMCEFYSVHIKNLTFENNDLSSCGSANRLGISLNNASIRNNKFPATTSTTLIRRPLGNIIIDNNTAKDSGISIGFSYYSYPDYYTEEDIANEKTHIEFTNNGFGLSGHFISQSRLNDKIDLIIENNLIGRMDVSYFGSKWEFNTSQLSSGLGNHPFSARGATFIGFAPYNYRYIPNGGGLWKVNDIISQNDAKITTCTKSGYTQVQGELKFCESDGSWASEASKNAIFYFISENKLYVTLTKGVFGTERPTHTIGVQTNGTIDVLFLSEVAEYTTTTK